MKRHNDLMFASYQIKSSSHASIMALLCFLCFSFVNASECDGNTLIANSIGRLIPIKESKIDKVICYNSKFQFQTSSKNIVQQNFILHN